jgi:hypothetical protein
MKKGALLGACLALPLAGLAVPALAAQPGAQPPNRRGSQRFNRLQSSSRLGT